MNYLTQNYNPQRITPKHSLRFPLSVSKIDGKFTQPVICDGLIFMSKAKVNVHAKDESLFQLHNENNEYPYVKGIFGGNSNSFLSEVTEGKIIELSCDNLQVLNEFDLGVTHSAKTISIGDFYILMYRKNRSRSFPLQVARKNFKDNSLLWQFQPENVISTFSVTEDNNFVVVADSKGTIYLLDINTGKVVWQQDVQSLGALTLAELNHRELPSLSLHDNLHIYKDTISLGYLFNYMVGIDLHTGELKWKKRIDYGVAYTTVDANGRQYYLASHSQASTLYIVNCKTGESIKEFIIDLSDEEIKNKFSSSVYSDVTTTHFFGVSQTGLLYAINLETGVMDWHYDLDSALVHNPFFICNNRLYITTTAGQFIFEGQGGYLFVQS
jgi:outer membrane protein assembly factor BamB